MQVQAAPYGYLPSTVLRLRSPPLPGFGFKELVHCGWVLNHRHCLTLLAKSKMGFLPSFYNGHCTYKSFKNQALHPENHPATGRERVMRIDWIQRWERRALPARSVRSQLRRADYQGYF